jgi:hypothetical protein
MPNVKKNKMAEQNNVTGPETGRTTPSFHFRAAGYLTKEPATPSSDAGLVTLPASAA